MINLVKRIGRKISNLISNYVTSPLFDLTVSILVAILAFWLTEGNFRKEVVNALVFGIIAGLIAFLLKLYVRLGNVAPTVKTLETTLKEFKDEVNNLENRFSAGLFITEGMRELHETWKGWRDGLDFHEDKDKLELERIAWKLLAEAYIQEEIQTLKGEYISTNTKCYTNFVTEASSFLQTDFFRKEEDTSDGNHKIVRYHLTGMLPEEFYNGPQIVFEADNSNPIFFCHQWENYDDFYADIYKGYSKNEEVKRCILVRNSDLRQELTSAFSTFEELKQQSLLSIIDRKRTVFDGLRRESKSVQKRLFHKCGSSQQNRYEDLIDNILGRQKYHYKPITFTNECNSFKNNKEWKCLIDFFAGDYHGDKSENAFYCTLDEQTYNLIMRSEQLSRCLRPGWLPEVVLFGKTSKNSKTIQWYFGILGHWRPFTTEIELKFLTSKQTQQLYKDFKRCANFRTKNYDQLLSLFTSP